MNAAGKRQAIKFATIDSTLALLFALFINAAILIVSAATFYTRGRNDIAELQDAYKLLSPMLGFTGVSSQTLGDTRIADLELQQVTPTTDTFSWTDGTPDSSQQNNATGLRTIGNPERRTVIAQAFSPLKAARRWVRPPPERRFRAGRRYSCRAAST